MASEHNLLKRHPFDLHAGQIHNPIEDYARHIRAFDDDTADPGVALEKIFEEMSYEDTDIEADLEYLTTVGFIDRELTDDGERSYSLSEEAEEYLEDFRGRTSSYTESVNQILRREI